MMFNKNVMLRLLAVCVFNSVYASDKVEIQNIDSKSNVKKPRLSLAIKQEQSQTYAIPTYDATFKHIMSAPEIYKSFLRAFIPNENITAISVLSEHLRPFKEYQKARTFVNDENSKKVIKRIKDLTQDGYVKDNKFCISFINTEGKEQEMNQIHGSEQFIGELADIYGDILKGYPIAERNSQVDFLCEVNKKYYAIVEVQVVPQDYWDKRALSYAANIYGRQLREGQGWDEIKKVICVNLLGGGPNDTQWPERTGFKRITFKDEANKEIEDGIEVLQYHLYYEALRDKNELDKRSTSENQKEYLDWIEFFEEAHHKKEADVAKVKSEAVKKAYNLIKTSSLPKNVEEEYQKQNAEFFKKYTSHIEYEKKNAKEEGIKEATVMMARSMLDMGMNLQQIASITKLTEEQIKALQPNQTQEKEN